MLRPLRDFHLTYSMRDKSCALEKGIFPEIYSMIFEMSIFIFLCLQKAIDSGCMEVFLLPKVLGVQQVFMTWHRGKWAYMVSFSCFHTDQMFVHDIILLSTPTCCYYHHQRENNKVMTWYYFTKGISYDNGCWTTPPKKCTHNTGGEMEEVVPM